MSGEWGVGVTAYAVTPTPHSLLPTLTQKVYRIVSCA